MNTPYAFELDPETVLQVLPERIAQRKRHITGLILDLEAATASPHVQQAELDIIEKDIRIQKSILQSYEVRLDGVREGMRKAAAGE